MKHFHLEQTKHPHPLSSPFVVVHNNNIVKAERTEHTPRQPHTRTRQIGKDEETNKKSMGSPFLSLSFLEQSKLNEFEHHDANKFTCLCHTLSHTHYSSV